jgi:hypothetical protein
VAGSGQQGKRAGTLEFDIVRMGMNRQNRFGHGSVRSRAFTWWNASSQTNQTRAGWQSIFTFLLKMNFTVVWIFFE